jgi:ATP-dependent helicase/nuclease subunit B
VTQRIFTVPAGQPFLDCLAKAILDGHLPAAGGRPPGPLEMADITLMLPTRRATRALQEAFLRVSGGRAMLLPQVFAISEGQEELSLLSDLTDSLSPGGQDENIAAAMDEMERRLTLANLVAAWSKTQQHLQDDETGRSMPATSAGTPAQAVTLAGELGRFMDMIETEGQSLAGLPELVHEGFSEHWQKTMDFLEIVTTAWPAILKDRGLLSAAGRRNAVIRAEALRLSRPKSTGPVIVAGVTGSVPATVELMSVVAGLKNGALVLPALDTDLDDESWSAIPAHPEHPQFGLAKLLDALGVRRGDVKILPGAQCEPEASARAKLISEAMRPSQTTGLWKDFAANTPRQSVSSALKGLSLIEAPSPQDEAEAIALILREAAETPGRTAALVSPDRLLARRVGVRLEAWGIKVDDSAGRPLAKTVPGAFLDLVIDAAAKNFAPAPLMSLLKHPLTRLGLDPFSVRRAARALEIAAFRTAFLGEGLDGVEAALERASLDDKHRHPAVRRLWTEDWDGARDLVARLRTAYAPLISAFGPEGATSLRDFAAAHVSAAEAIAELPPPAEKNEDGEAEPGTVPSAVWSGEGGETAHSLFTQLLDEALPSLEIVAGDYADLYRSLVVGVTVRPRSLVHPRLFIWGPFEARLQQTDVVVLGSLNDGTWPDAADPGPWLNRPMRAALGLPSPEEKIGLSAHDFTSLLGTSDVILTRAQKMDGVPTVPSRWLMRLTALLGGLDAVEDLKPALPWADWSRQRDRPDPVPRISAPEPRPPVKMRPRKLSVSRVETWIANPYEIFAKEILRLEPLDGLGQEPGPSLRGSIIHEALSRFSRSWPDKLPGNIKDELVAHASAVLEEYAAHPRIAAFWVPRFERFADWFTETEPTRRAGGVSVIAETSGSLVFKTPGGDPFTLTARADRIDTDGAGLVITDYKTGQTPTDTKVNSLLAPQLPLEAAIAMAANEEGGFASVPKLPVTGLRYIRASGGEPAGDSHDVKCDDLGKLTAEARTNLERQVILFENPQTPYRALRRAGFTYDWDDYAHLARVSEWSAASAFGEDS